MNDSPLPPNDDSANAPAPSRRRWLTYGFLGLLIAMALLAMLFPAILSTPLGRSVVVGAINDNVRGSVTIDAMSLSWLKGQSLRGLEILDPTGAKVGRLEELSTELTLLEAIQRKLSLGQTVIRGLSADLVVDESGVNNLTQALAPEQPSKPGAAPLAVPFTGNIELKDAQLTLKTSNAKPMMFGDLTAAMRIEPAGRMLDFTLQGSSRQGDQTGKFNIKGQISGLIAPDGALSPQTAQGNLQANVEDLPIDSVDAILGLKGLLSTAAGNTASLQIQASGTADVQDILVTADSPNIRAEIAAQLNKDRFALTQPSSVRLSVTPDLFQALAKTDQDEAALRLVEPFQLNLKAARLDLPISDFNLADVALSGGVEVNQPVQFAAPDLGEVTIRSLNAAVDTERLAESISIELDSEAVSLNESGKLTARATLDRIVNEAGVVQLDKMRADVVADLANVPLLLVDKIAAQNGQLVALLGPRMDLSAKAVSSGPDQIDATLTIDAGPLKATDVNLSLTDSLVLNNPVQIHYMLSPQVARRILGGDQAYGLRQPAGLMLDIQAFSAPRPKPGEPVFQPAETMIQGTLTSERLVLSGGANFDTLQVDGTRFDLNADSLASIHLRGAAKVSEVGDGILTELSASPLQISFVADTGLDATGATGPIDAQLALVGEAVRGAINLRVTPDLSRATVTAPGNMRLVLTPGLLQQLGLVLPNQVTLGQPTPIEISLSRLDLPLAAFSWSELQAKAAVRVNELILAGDKSLKGASLRNSDIAVEYDGANGSASVKLEALTVAAVDQQSGTLKADAKLERLLRNGELSLDAAVIDAEANIDALPTAVLSAFGGQPVLVPIIGDVVNISASVNVTGDKGAGSVELKTDSRNLAADAGFKLGDELALSRPASVRLKLTPAGYEALMVASSASSEKAASASGYALAEDAIFEAVVSTLRWPLADPFNPSRAAVVLTAKTPRLSLRDRVNGQTVSIEMFEMALKGSDLSKPIDIEIDGRIRDARSDKTEPGDAAGRIAMSGHAADLFTPEGRVNAEGLSLRLDGKLQELPTALLDELLDVDGIMVATLGDMADISVAAEVRRMAGPLNLRLRSPNATADVKTKLSEEGLVLTEPLLIEVQVTPGFGKLVLGKIHPIFETAQSSDRAVRFDVPSEGTLIPVWDYDVSKVVIPRMMLDVGTLTLKSGWLLKGAIGLAQQFGALKASGLDQWTAQFTPAVLKMSGGEVTYERRLDLLLDERMHMATWGTADIANDRANLTLAFMPETLEKVFGLTVAPGDALRIPLRGALSGPSVDFARAGLEIERLRQQQRLSRQDALVGALVGAVATTAIGGGPIPPPSVTPLPWGALPAPEGQLEARQTEDSQQPAQPAPKNLEQQAIEGLIGILRKKKE